MKKMILIIETSEDGFLGRVHYEDNLLIDEADSVIELENKLKKMLKKFHALNPKEIVLQHEYDISALFEAFDYLKISSVAKYAGINAALMRQYASGVKNPSQVMAKKIEDTLHKLAYELSHVKLYAA